MIGQGSATRFSAYIDNRVLAANTAETVTKPTGTVAQIYNSCIITATADVYLRRGGTAAVPAADVTDGTGSWLLALGKARILDFHDDDNSILATFSIICAGVAIVSMEWFK